MRKRLQFPQMGRSCTVSGGCPSDYIAVAISILSLLLLLARATLPFLFQKTVSRKSSGFWLVLVQIIGSINMIVSLVMSMNLFDFSRRHFWQSCYFWAVWIEGPFGFGLLMSCRIVQAYQLYHVFVKRRLPPVKSYVLLPLIVLPWVCGAACLETDIQDEQGRSDYQDFCRKSVTFLHLKRPLNHLCHMGRQWVIPVVCIHALYVVALIGVTRSVRHIEFKFHEFKDLLQGIIVSTIAIGLWIAAYIVNEAREDISWVQISSRFLLLLMASILVLVFFSMSISQPLLSQISLRQRDTIEATTMREALGITADSGSLMLVPTAKVGDLNQPFDKLLANKRFRQSFMAFADSCLAGEGVHFFEEVLDLSKIPANDAVRRVYMARHIIEKYVVAGAEMEVNISHKTRQEILGTCDLSHSDLFNHATSEVIQLLKTNLARDYWLSIYSVRFKEEAYNRSESFECTGRDFSPRVSCVQCSDDPFQQQNMHQCPT